MTNYLQKLRSHVGNEEIIINCSAVWVENENGVLLERRGDDGHWGLIGGVMELGESPGQTALRELEEETGVQAVLGKLIGVYSKHRHTYPNGDRAQPVVFFFECTVNSEQQIRLSEESHEIRYFGRDSLPQLGMPQHQQMLNDAILGRHYVIE